MSWSDEVRQIEERRRRALELGGEEAVRRHRERGKRTVRERIDDLVDEGSFRDEGPLAGWAEQDEDGELRSFTPANYVLGVATIDGRRVVVGGEDFTQRGGSPTPAGLRKSVWSEELALRYRMPLVRFLEGGGGSVTGSGGKGSRAPVGDPVYSRARFLPIAQLLHTVPVASAAVGAVAGFPAARLVASHFAVMVKDTSQVLIGGPALVERALGEKLDKEQLGGWRVHARSGVVDRVADDEAHANRLIRRFLDYLPSSVLQAPPRRPSQPDDRRDRREEELLSIVPRDRRRPYDVERLVGLVVDRGSLLEKGEQFGRSQRTFLARIDGYPVGVLANDPTVLAGSMDRDGALKVRRFVELCDTFHLPVVAFVDEPGFYIGSAAEQAGTIRYGMEAISAVVRSRTPWISIVVRRAYGVAAAAHFGPEARVLSWPSADTGALPVEGGVAVAFRREIAEAEDPEARRAELEEQFAARRSPFPRAESFSVHDLIDPRDTRLEISRWLDLAWPLVEEQARG
ncbi:MAG: propionyl-CoA carboxylase [Acidobacteria bacterium]|nr:MAG: propionyl-CoA carboxylase [Acidobacteriota bacterium]REK11751.1 MAG: propionyl-CoA carboxylase [Acidobacteriota bacterium]